MAESERQALVAAIRALPRLPAWVAVIDANDAAPEVKATLLQLDTFITRGSPVVYVLRHSALLQGAKTGDPFHILALSAALWHEIAHTEGPTNAAHVRANSPSGPASCAISESIS